MTVEAAPAKSSIPQSFWLVGALVLNALVSLLTIPLFVELLSKADLAILAQASGIALAVSTICSLGAGTIGPHIVSGKLEHLKSYDELLANQLFVAICLLVLLAAAAVLGHFSATALIVFALNYAGGVLSAISPNWLMIQLGLAQRIFRYHLAGRLIYVASLAYFSFVGGGLIAVSLGVFAGALLTTALIFRAAHASMPFKIGAKPSHLGSLLTSAAVTSSAVATAVFATIAPFILESWIGVGAVTLFYVVERARLFITEIMRAAEAPYYQHVAQAGEYRHKSYDSFAMPACAVLMALAFPILAAWGPKLAVIAILKTQWPFLSAFSIAFAMSARAMTLFVDGKRAFAASALLRNAATAAGFAALMGLAAHGVEQAYADAIILVEGLVALFAIAYALMKGR